MNIDLICYIAAGVCLLLKAFGVGHPRVDLVALAGFFLVLSLVI
jgi:hypothetical protein